MCFSHRSRWYERREDDVWELFDRETGERERPVRVSDPAPPDDHEKEAEREEVTATT